MDFAIAAGDVPAVPPLTSDNDNENVIGASHGTLHTVDMHTVFEGSNVEVPAPGNADVATVDAVAELESTEGDLARAASSPER